MTDLEMTRLCAEAMGFKPVSTTTGETAVLCAAMGGLKHDFYFDPLHNDAQLMALVKKFPILDLNRAMVERVAKMQAAKAVQP